MKEDTVVQLRQPGTFSEDPLTEILRLGARRLLAQAVEMEVTAFIEGHAELTDDAGRRRVVRHGYSPEREIQTGIGPVAVRCPRVRDRGANAVVAKPISFKNLAEKISFALRIPATPAESEPDAPVSKARVH